MHWVLIVALVWLALTVLITEVWAYQTAPGLDRLLVRYDLSWQALDGALARRAVVARAVAADAYGSRPAGRPAPSTGRCRRPWCRPSETGRRRRSP